MRSARRWFAPLAAAGMIALGMAGTAMAQTEDPDLILRVRANQTAAWSSQSGASWSAAYRTLRDGIDAAKAWVDDPEHDEDIVHIWVRQGTYVPDESDNPALECYPDPTPGCTPEECDPICPLENNRDASFILHSRIEIYAGFDGTETSEQFELRDWENNVTTLSGDLMGDEDEDLEDDPDAFDEGDYGTYESDNAFNIIRSSADDTAILDGFTISGGFRTGATPGKGGGVQLIGSADQSPRIQNCTIERNFANRGGGGMFVQNYEESWVRRNWFIANRSPGEAGGLLNAASRMIVANCQFTENVSENRGGALDSFVPAIQIINTRFVSNRAVGAGARGGAIFIGEMGGGGGPNGTEITNCLFSDNQAGDEGGAIWGNINNVGTVPITNCMVYANVAGDKGGGIALSTSVSGSAGSKKLAIRNTIAYGNTAGSGTTQEQQLVKVTAAASGAFDVGYSDIEGWCSGITCGDIVGTCTDCYDAATGNLDADPDFRGSTNFYLQYDSPCVDAGNNSLLPPDTADLDDNPATTVLPVDLNGSLRVQDGDDDLTATVDMGVYELAPPSTCAPDLNGNCTVNGIDLALLLGAWGPCSSCDEDINSDGVVDGLDLALLLGMWGPCEDCESLLLFGGGEEESEDDEDYPLLLWWLLTGDYASIFAWADSQ